MTLRVAADEIRVDDFQYTINITYLSKYIYIYIYIHSRLHYSEHIYILHFQNFVK